MKKEITLWKSTVAGMLIAALMFCTPIEAAAQAAAAGPIALEAGTQMMLSIDREFKADRDIEAGLIPATVAADVYSADSTRVLIPAGTHAWIEYLARPNGSWGKAGKICVTGANTKTVDGKPVELLLGNCKSGASPLGAVIAISLIFFPFGLVSGFMRGSMPRIPAE